MNHITLSTDFKLNEESEKGYLQVIKGHAIIKTHEGN